MFHDIPRAMIDRMRQLELADAADRDDGTERMKRLRQIPPDTGKFIALLAAGAPEGKFIEIGTSAGYSTMWLALACRAAGRKLTTFELLDEKVALARETFSLAGVEDVVKLVHGDAREHFIVVCLDARNEAVAFQAVSVGTANSSIVHPREVFQLAVHVGAVQILLAHNHPSGDPSPSSKDREVTKRLVKAGEIMGIKILDHVISGRDGFYSFDEHGEIE